MRLENVEKAGYFPLPPTVTQLIATYIAAPHGGRIYDPCAGQGHALAYLARELKLEPYGVELHHERAERAGQVIASTHGRVLTQEPYPYDKRIINQDFRKVNAGMETFNLLYANPPYMFASEEDPDDKEFGRDEYMWLVETRKYLQPGGLLVWVVPHHMLLHQKTQRYLPTWYDNLTIRRFPDPEYDEFRQVVVFGTRRANKRAPNPETIKYLYGLGIMGKEMETLQSPPGAVYSLPPLIVPAEKMIFRDVVVLFEDALKEAQTSGVQASAEFKLHLNPTQLRHRMRPLTAMKKGHLVSVLAAGLLNGTILDDGKERLLIKGQAYKTSVKTEKTDQTEDGGYTVTETVTERVMTRLTSLHTDGTITELTGENLTAFLTKWIDHLTTAVAQTYQPLYQFDLAGFGPTIRHLNPYRQIPRMNRTGVLPAQAHAIAAAALRLEHANDAYIIGEMGTGKTVMGIGVAAALYAKSNGRKYGHTIIMCPPHLSEKWQREIGHVWPAATTMELKTISDVDRFFAHTGPIIGVMKETSGRSATGWNHTYSYNNGIVVQSQRKPKEVMNILKRGILHQGTEWIKEQKNIRVNPDKLAGLIYYRSDAVRCPTCGNVPEFRGNAIMVSDFTNSQLRCNHCNHALYQYERRNANPKRLPGGDFATYAKREDEQRHKTLAQPENDGYAKWPLATYIKQHYKGKLDLFIADEMHQFKGADSDRGYAYHRLCTAANKILGLTGTLYGGKASTLFHLLYRSSPLIRKHFTDPTKEGIRRMEWRKWVENYGILQEIESTHFDANGKSSGNSKSNKRIKELPGGSPAMLPWLLEACIFVSLADMGFALPGYREIPIIVDMDSLQRAQYRSFESDMKKELALRLKVKDKSLLGAYVQSTLTLPDSPWRNKGVIDRKGRTVAFANAIPGGPFPKEEEIRDLIIQKVEKGERVLLLCQQTNTLDITPYWMELLKGAGLRPAVLKADPDKREAWIKKAVEKDDINVLITHPKKVETGLDLLDFPTIIWMGTEYSLYTIQQANRRSWRIGQEKDVEVYYFVYDETMQATALRIIASKLGTAARINGDLIPDDDDGMSAYDESTSTDLVNALAGLLESELDREEAMKMVNDAYDKAKAGNTNAFAGTPYSFAGCQSSEEIKQRYRQLSKQYHPDMEASAEEEEKSTVDSLNDLFSQANASFEQDGVFMADDDTAVVDDAIDEVIRKLILGDKAAPQPEAKPEPQPAKAKAKQNGAYVEPDNEPATIFLAGIGHVPVEERHNYRLTFGNGYVHVDEYDRMQAAAAAPPPPAPAAKPEPVTAVASTDAEQPGAADDGYWYVDKATYQAIRNTLQPKGKIFDLIDYNGKKYVFTDSSFGAEHSVLHLYEIDLTGEHMDLIWETITPAMKKKFGDHHGRVVKYHGFKHVLVGPPVKVLPEGTAVIKSAAPEAPKPAPAPVTKPKPEPVRLVFGVHTAQGSVRTNGVDKVAQMSMFG